MGTPADALREILGGAKLQSQAAAGAPDLTATLHSILSGPGSSADPNDHRAEFTRGVASGVDQLGALTYGLASMAGDALGHKGLQDWGAKGYQAKTADSEAEGVNVKSMSDIHGFHDLLDYVSAQAGQAVPTLATGFGGGAAGSFLAKKLVMSALEKAVLSKSAEAMIGGEVTKEMAEGAVSSAAKKLVVGSTLGAMATNYPQNVSMAYSELKADKGVKDPISTALVASLGMSALEAAPFAMGVNAVVQAQLKQRVAESLGKSLLEEVPKMAAVASATMGGQQATLIGAHAIANPDFDWKDEESRHRVLEAMGSGAIVGTLLGAGFGSVAHAFGVKAPEVTKPEDVVKNAFVDRGPAEPDKPATARPYTPDSDSIGGPKPAVAGDDATAGMTEAGNDEPTRYLGKDGTFGQTPADVTPWSPTSHESDKPNRFDAVHEALAKLDDSNPAALKDYFDKGYIKRDDDGKVVPTDYGRMIMDVNPDVAQHTSVVASARDSYKSTNPHMDYEEKRLPDGRWVIAETQGDVMKAEARGDVKGRGPVPLTEAVSRTFATAKENARNLIRAGKGDRVMEFELYNDRAQKEWDKTPEAQREGPRPSLEKQGSNVNLAAPSISALGRRYDRDGSAQGELAQRRRAFDQGIAHLATNPVDSRVTPEGTHYNLYAKPAIDRTDGPVPGSRRSRGGELGQSKSNGNLMVHDSVDRATGEVQQTRLRELRDVKGYVRPEAADEVEHAPVETANGDISGDAALHQRAQEDVAAQAGASASAADLSRRDNDVGTTGTMSPGRNPSGVEPPRAARSEPAPVRDNTEYVHQTLTELNRHANLPFEAHAIQLKPEEISHLRNGSATLDEKLADVRKLIGGDWLDKTLGSGAAHDVAQLVLDRLNAFDKGFIVTIGDRRFIYVDPMLKAAEKVVVLSHEIGHGVFDHAYAHATTEERTALLDAHDRYARETGKPLPFHEWAANQFSSWAVRRDAPTTVLQKFLKVTADKLRQIWDYMRARRGLDETFAKFMDGVAESMGLTGKGPDSLWQEQYAHLGIAADRMWELPNKDARVQSFTKEDIAKLPAYVRNTVNRFKQSDVGRTINTLWGNLIGSSNGYVRRLADHLSPEVKGQVKPLLDKYMRIFHTEPGEKGGANYSVMQHSNQKEADGRVAGISRMLEKSLGGKDKNTAEYKAAEAKIMSELYRVDGKPGKLNLPPELQRVAEAARSHLNWMLRYLDAHDMPHGVVKDNYFPRSFSEEIFNVDKQDDILRKIRSTGKTLQEAQTLLEDIKTGTTMFSETQRGLLQQSVLDMKSPTAQALKHRELDNDVWAALADYRDPSLNNTLFKYSRQIMDRTQYNDHFGMSKSQHAEQLEKWQQNRDAAEQDLRNRGLSGDALELAMQKEAPTRPQYRPHYKFEQMLDGMRKAGLDEPSLNSVIEMHGMLTGQGTQRMDPAFKRVMNNVMTYEATRTLPFAACGALFDLAGPALRMGDFKLGMRALSYTLKNREEAQTLLRSLHLTVDTIADTAMMDGANRDAPGWAANKASEMLFKYSQMQRLDNFTRAAGAVAARMAFREYAVKAAAGDRFAKSFLDEVNVTPEHVAEWQKNGERMYGLPGQRTIEDVKSSMRDAANIRDATKRDAALQALTPEQRAVEADFAIHSASMRITNESKVLHASAAEKPKYANNPYLAPLYMLKGFVYAFQSRVNARMYHNFTSADGPSFGYGLAAPAGMALVLTAAGIALRQGIQYDAPNAIFGRNDQSPTSKMDTLEYLFRIVEKSGALGLAQFGFDAVHAAKQGSAMASILGPLVDQGDATMRHIVNGKPWHAVAAATPVINVWGGLKKPVEQLDSSK